MHTNADFPVANPAESNVYTIDFINDIPDGQTVSGATVSLTVFNGDDPDPTSHVIGSYFLTNPTFVSQIVRNLLPGVTYSLNIIAVTSAGFSVELYALIPCRAVYY